MAEGTLKDNPSVAESSNLDDVDMALEGMKYLLENDWEKSLELFGKYKDHSPIMCSGNSWVIFMQALMTFEEEQMQIAMKVLQDTEKKCAVNNTGVFKSIAKKMSRKKSKNAEAIEDKLQRQIIVADCIIHQAILTFINQDISSYIKGGWLLRKAYKIYEKLHKQIKAMYDASVDNKGVGLSTSQIDGDLIVKIESDNHLNNSATSDISAEYHVTAGNDQLTNELTNETEEAAEEAVDVLDIENSQDSEGSSANGKLSSSGSQSSLLSHCVIERLLGSVSLGRGAFQLAISLIPPKILKVIEFLGFEGDRESGLKDLEFASHSRDMKAPLASLGLMWYHTAIRPFFALDGNAVDAGVADAMVIIDRCERIYPNSGLFLFFQGRAERLQCKLDQALTTYRSSLASCEGQREMELICYHEIGWIEMMKLNMPESIKCFTRLKHDSRWSKSYYAFLLAMCSGASGDLDEAKKQLQDVPKLIRNKNNQVEQFVLKRAEKFQKKVALSPENCTLFILEVIYLWNALTQCPGEDIDRMVAECNKFSDKSLFHLKCLIEGALYRQKKDEVMSSQCFEEAIARREGMKEDAHIAAYAMYELGLTKAQQPQTYEDGKKLLKKARDGFKEYDFDNRLSVRVNAALKRLSHEGTPL